jgi:hypothetical protein
MNVVVPVMVLVDVIFVNMRMAASHVVFVGVGNDIVILSHKKHRLLCRILPRPTGHQAYCTDGKGLRNAVVLIGRLWVKLASSRQF